ncbi:MAG TPA: hypothetical protein VJ723_14380 [Candidatus Angelobacter sp.]|nr:hypothetical protein [Candidatus Angelobacter sp.]
MARWEQYEIWVKKAEQKWETLALFRDVELAMAVLSQRSGRTRLIQVVYEDNKMVSQEIIADLGHVGSPISAVT